MKTFKDIVNEESIEIGYISHSLFVIAQTHIFHWLTKSGQEHEAIGEFYEELQNALDAFTERFIGKYGDLPTDSDNVTFYFEYSTEDLLYLLEEYDDLTSQVIDEFDPVDDASIIDSLVDVKELIDQLRFKLRLK